MNLGKLTITIEADSIDEARAMLLGSTALTPRLHPDHPNAPHMLAAGAMPINPAADEEGPLNTAAPAADAVGLPWDERIHSSNRATNADGTWRKRRGVQESLVTQVEAELRGRGGVQTQPAAQTLPEPPAAVTPAAMAMPAAASQPAAMAMPAAVTPAGAVDFTTFMQSFSRAMQTPGQDGKPLIDLDYLTRLNTWLGVGNITDIASQPELIERAVGQLKTDGRWI